MNPLDKYRNKTTTIHANDIFTDAEKKLFLKIPHKVEKINSINKITFDVSENVNNNLNHTYIVELTENLSKEQMNDEEIFSLLYQTNCKGKKGLYIESYHGSVVIDLIKELYKFDPENAEVLLKEYFELTLQCEDISNIADSFVKQTSLMQQYLKEANIIVDDYKIDYSIYNGKNDDEMEEAVKKLEKKYDVDVFSNFPSYNDLDYTPMILDGDYCIHDSSSSKLFVIKEFEKSKKLYEIDIYSANVMQKTSEWLHDFMYEHKQYYIAVKNTFSEKDLIGEIVDGVLVKASIDLTTINLLQSYIVKELVKEGKIREETKDLSFKELLENYTMQNELWNIEERAIIPLLSKLSIVNNMISYEDYSYIKDRSKIKHEEITDSTLEDLLGITKTGKPLDYIRKNYDFTNMCKMPEKYKEQLCEYLEQLEVTYPKENTVIFTSKIKEMIQQPKKKKTSKMK